MNITHYAAIATLLVSPFALFAQTTPPASQDTASVSGTALYRERIALPQTAVFEAVLQDISLADAPAKRIASTKHAHPGNPPFRFTITYNPAKIVQSHTYTVRATVTVDGKLMFTSTTAAPVITNGHPNEVSLVLHHVTQEDAQPAVASRGVAAEPLEDSYWKLVSLNGKEVVVAPEHREPSLILHPEGMRTEVFGGCNNIAGTYKLSGNKLEFGPMAGTLMACPEGMDTEKDFTATLNVVRTYRIYGQHLNFFDENNKTVASFLWRVMK
jgi:putative lipoprotein